MAGTEYLKIQISEENYNQHLNVKIKLQIYNFYFLNLN